MIRRDYTEELTLAPRETPVKWQYVILIFALLGVGVGWFATVEIKAYRAEHRHHASEVSAAPLHGTHHLAAAKPAAVPHHHAAS